MSHVKEGIMMSVRHPSLVREGYRIKEVMGERDKESRGEEIIDKKREDISGRRKRKRRRTRCLNYAKY